MDLMINYYYLHHQNLLSTFNQEVDHIGFNQIQLHDEVEMELKNMKLFEIQGLLKLLDLFYLDLFKFGLPESEFNLSKFPLRLPLKTTTTTTGQQNLEKYDSHYFFDIKEEDIKSYAHINLFINSLLINSQNIDVWCKLHEKIYEMSCRCLDDISYRIYPLKNIPINIMNLCFENLSCIQHLLLGTFTKCPEDITKDLLDKINIIENISFVQRNQSTLYNSCCYESKNNNQSENNVCKKNMYFISSFEGRKDGPAIDYPVTLTDADSYLLLLLGKFNTLRKINENIANQVHYLHQQLKSKNNSFESPDLAYSPTKYVVLCELRTVFYFTLSKIFQRKSIEHQQCLQRVYFNSVLGNS